MAKKDNVDIEVMSQGQQLLHYKIKVKELKDKVADLKNARPKISTIKSLDLPNDTKKIIEDLVHAFVDPTGQFYECTEEKIMQIIQNKFKEGTFYKAAAIDSLDLEDGINYTSKGLQYDEYLESFVLGCGGRLSRWEDEVNTKNPLIIRGLGGNSRKALKHCWETKRDFYAIDTGYFGNERSKSKYWHRITKNALQNTGPIIERPTDRLGNYKYKKFKPGSKILICPPSEKVMMVFDQPDPETWVKNTVAELKKYTDRPIEIRMKPVRADRISTNTIEEALQNDVHCLITYNSIAALEALVNGKPAIALGPNCATTLCNTSLADIEKLNKPSEDRMTALMAHLSYCQFTRQEMMNGYAWNIVNESR